MGLGREREREIYNEIVGREVGLGRERERDREREIYNEIVGREVGLGRERERERFTMR